MKEIVRRRGTKKRVSSAVTEADTTRAVKQAKIDSAWMEGKFNAARVRAHTYGVDPSKWAADRALIEEQHKGAHATPRLWGPKDGQAVRVGLNYGSLDLRALLQVKGATSYTRPLPVLRNAVEKVYTIAITQ